MHEAVAA